MPVDPAASHPDVHEQVELAAQEYGPDFDPTPLNLTLLLYRMISVLDRAHAVELLPIEVNGSQFNVLTVLHRSPVPMTMGALARAVSVRPANLTNVVNSLQDMGYVSRNANPADGRSSLISITPEGHERLARFLPGHWDFLGAVFSGLDRDQRVQLIELLSQLVTRAEDSPEERQPDLAENIIAAARHGWDRSGKGPTRARRGRRSSTRYAGSG